MLLAAAAHAKKSQADALVGALDLGVALGR